MTLEQQHQMNEGPLPRNREAVDWWLKKWGRQAVLDEKEPLNRKDVDRLIVVNEGTAEGLDLTALDMRKIYLGKVWDPDDGEQTINLRGASLFHANLQNARLQYVNLQNANLGSADLRGADVSRGNLCGARLDEADLRETVLEAADLRRANLIWADLRGTYLKKVDLRGANLDSARISPETNLGEVVWDKKYINVLEREGHYGAAIDLYRRLKEWYHYAGMSTIAGEFHYREREANRKLRWQRLGNDFKDYKRQMAIAWQRFAGKDAPKS